MNPCAMSNRENHEPPRREWRNFVLPWVIGGTALVVASWASFGAQSPPGEKALNGVRPLQTAARPDPAIWNFKERRPLTMDRSRIAIFDPTARSGAEVVALAARGGWAESALSTEAIRGWWLLDVADRGEDETGVAALTERLADSAGTMFVTPVFQGQQGATVAPSPWLLVRFAAGVGAERAAAILTEAQAGQVVEADFGGLSNAYRVRTRCAHGLEVLALAESLARRPDVEFAEPDMVATVNVALVPNDPVFGQCWALHNTGQPVQGYEVVADMDIDAVEAWDITTGDPGVLVVVLDNGVQQDHPDINQIPGFDVTGEGGGGGPVNPCDIHGTAIGGIIAAKINNGVGTVGVAPTASVVSVRVAISRTPCDGSWMSTDSWFVNALAVGESIGARVTNNSTGYWTQSSAVRAKFAETYAAGMVHFAATGNGALPEIHPVSAFPGVNAVAALNPDGTLASFSNYGPGLDYSAPGVHVCCTDRTGSNGCCSGDHGFLYGTSAASPIAAGVAALVLSVNPSLTAPDVEDILNRSSVDLGEPGYDTTYGWGFVNAFNALELASAPTATVTSAVSRKACDLDLTLSGPITAEPRQGGVSELRITFDTAPGGPGSNPVTLEEKLCTPPGTYGAYTGSATVNATIAGHDLVLTFSPSLENGRTYRLGIGGVVTSISGQFIEVRALMGDTTSDGFADGTDRSVVIGIWTGQGFSCATDLNGDGATDATDRSIAIGAWTGAENCVP